MLEKWDTLVQFQIRFFNSLYWDLSSITGCFLSFEICTLKVSKMVNWKKALIWFTFYFVLFFFSWEYLQQLTDPLHYNSGQHHILPLPQQIQRYSCCCSWQQIARGTWCSAESLEEFLFGNSKVSHVFCTRVKSLLHLLCSACYKRALLSDCKCIVN